MTHVCYHAVAVYDKDSNPIVGCKYEHCRMMRVKNSDHVCPVTKTYEEVYHGRH